MILAALSGKYGFDPNTLPETPRMKGIVSSDRTNGQSALFPVSGAEGRQTYAIVKINAV